jgi:hypothetical protein
LILVWLTREQNQRVVDRGGQATIEVLPHITPELYDHEIGFKFHMEENAPENSLPFYDTRAPNASW